MHSTLNYLIQVDYYTGNPETLLVERKKKLTAVADRRKEANNHVDLMETGVGGA